MFVIMSCASKVYTRPDCCHIVTRSWVVVEHNGVGEGDEEGVGVGIIMHVYFLPGLPLLFSGTAPALCNCMQCFSSSKWRWKQLFGVPGTAGCLFEKGRGLGNYGTNWTIILGSSFFFLFLCAIWGGCLRQREQQPQSSWKGYWLGSVVALPKRDK